MNAIDEAMHGESSINPDREPPRITEIRISDITENSALISWESDKKTAGRIDYGTDTGYGELSPEIKGLESASLLHSVTLSGLTAGTLYHFRIYSIDLNGNESYSEDSTFSTLSDFYDREPPLITNAAIVSISENSAAVSWQTDEKSTANVHYGESLPFTQSAPLPADTSADSTKHTVLLSGLKPGIKYLLSIISSDTYGNESIEYSTFSTPVGKGVFFADSGNYRTYLLTESNGVKQFRVMENRSWIAIEDPANYYAENGAAAGIIASGNGAYLIFENAESFSALYFSGTSLSPAGGPFTLPQFGFYEEIPGSLQFSLSDGCDYNGQPALMFTAPGPLYGNSLSAPILFDNASGEWSAFMNMDEYYEPVNGGYITSEDYSGTGKTFFVSSGQDLYALTQAADSETPGLRLFIRNTEPFPSWESISFFSPQNTDFELLDAFYAADSSKIHALIRTGGSGGNGSELLLYAFSGSAWENSGTRADSGAFIPGNAAAGIIDGVIYAAWNSAENGDVYAAGFSDGIWEHYGRLNTLPGVPGSRPALVKAGGTPAVIFNGTLTTGGEILVFIVNL